MKKYLVLGGNGFIGKYIVNQLSLSNEVVVADYNIEHTEENEHITYKKLDFIGCEDFSDYLDGVDTVIHLISTIGPNDRTDTINQEIYENIFPTVRLLENMVQCGTQKIIFVSSGGTVYGEHSLDPICESDSKNPICNYGILKELIEKYLHLYHVYYGMEYKVIRLANPYSDVVKKGKKQGIIPILIDQISKGETVRIWGDGEDVRDYIYIDDAVDAIMKIIHYDGEEATFNVGTGIGYSINSVLEVIEQEMGVEKPSIEYVDGRKCDVRNNVLNVDRIREETGWQATTPLKSGIQKVIEMKKGW